MNPVLQTFFTVLDELESAGVDYMVMGGWAVQVWGRPRPTFDVDFTLSISDAELHAFLRGLAARGFIVDDVFLRGFKDNLAGYAKIQVSLFQERDPVRVDFFIARSEYQRMAFSRRVQVTMLARELWVMAPEDLILHKLVARRHKDLAAIEEILELHGDSGRLNSQYLRDWAKVLKVDEALNRLLEP